ncbi:MAG TPA: hypothetical protein VMU59_14300 [Caulobacteraceae bacterium]|nr:hypothetical protein [Caulobacteraceae bacterium]
MIDMFALAAVPTVVAAFALGHRLGRRSGSAMDDAAGPVTSVRLHINAPAGSSAGGQAFSSSDVEAELMGISATLQAQIDRLNAAAAAIPKNTAAAVQAAVTASEAARTADLADAETAVTTAADTVTAAVAAIAPAPAGDAASQDGAADNSGGASGDAAGGTDPAGGAA